MANIKGGLGGKGLSALFVDSQENIKVETENFPATDIDITLIDRNPNQPRKTFNDDSLKEMSKSIAVYGVLQPLILVKGENGRFIIIAGERRFRASLMAGLKKVPAIIRDFSQQQIQEISLIENLHREDLNAIEAAEGMRELMENHGLTQEEVASRLGKSRPYVTNILRLLQLPSEITDMVRQGQLSPGHARALIPIDDKNYMISLAKRVCNGDMSVRDLETHVRLYNNRKSIKTGPRDKHGMPIELKAFVDEMKQLFSTKVIIKGNETNGRIYIDYFTADDLERIHSIVQMLKFNNKL